MRRGELAAGGTRLSKRRGGRLADGDVRVHHLDVGAVVLLSRGVLGLLHEVLRQLPVGTPDVSRGWARHTGGNGTTYSTTRLTTNCHGSSRKPNKMHQPHCSADSASQVNARPPNCTMMIWAPTVPMTMIRKMALFARPSNTFHSP